MQILENVVPCDPYELPNGVGVIELPYDGTVLAFHKAPGGLMHNNRVYGKSSHNSDTFKIVYRTDQNIAFNL